MSELDFWRSAGLTPESSGSGGKQSVGSGKGSGAGRSGMASPVENDTPFDMKARATKEHVKQLPRASVKLGSSPSKGVSKHTTAGRAPSLAHVPDNPAAAGYRPQTPPSPGQPRGVFVRAYSNAMQRAVFRGTQKHIGALASRQQFVTALRNKAVYMTKDGKGRDGGPADGFTDDQDRIDARATVDRWISEGDVSASWHFVSPEHGNRIDDFQDYMRRTMFKVERDLLTKQELAQGHKLEWFGVEHGDKPHRHGHVVIRHRINGKHIRLDQDYLNNGMEVRAREAATEVLGNRGWREIEATTKREQTREYKDERLAKHINQRTLGWRLEAKLNMRDLDGVDRLRSALRSAKVYHKLNSQTGELTVFSSTHATSLATADAIAGDFGSLLRLPNADAMKRGMQFGNRIWGRFVVPNTDDRFAQTGVAGVPLLKDDLDRIRAAGGDRELLTDAAVLRANEVLSNTYQKKLIGHDAAEGESLTTHGWVLNINADHNIHKVAAELTELGIQYRPRKEIDAQGNPALVVTAYVGSMDDAEYVAGHISDRLGGELRPLDRADEHARYRFADGIDGRFIPHAEDRALLGVGDHTEYLNGLPATHFSQPGMSREQRLAVAEDYLTGHYGSYLQGSAETDTGGSSSAPVTTVTNTVSAQVETETTPTPEKQQTVKVERKPDGLEL